MVKKLSDEKPGDPRLGFCDFLKVEVVQVMSDSYDEFQQEIFNLGMRLKCRQMKQTFTHDPQALPHQQHLQHSQQHFQQTFT